MEGILYIGSIENDAFTIPVAKAAGHHDYTILSKAPDIASLTGLECIVFVGKQTSKKNPEKKNPFGSHSEYLDFLEKVIEQFPHIKIAGLLDAGTNLPDNNKGIGHIIRYSMGNRRDKKQTDPSLVGICIKEYIGNGHKYQPDKFMKRKIVLVDKENNYNNRLIRDLKNENFEVSVLDPDIYVKRDHMGYNVRNTTLFDCTGLVDALAKEKPNIILMYYINDGFNDDLNLDIRSDEMINAIRKRFTCSLPLILLSTWYNNKPKNLKAFDIEDGHTEIIEYLKADHI